MNVEKRMTTYPSLPYKSQLLTCPWEYLHDGFFYPFRTAEQELTMHQDLVWSEEQQISYVEFALMNDTSEGKILTFNCADFFSMGKKPMLLIDGKQRMHAVWKFINNNLSVFGGHSFSTFDDRLPHHAMFYLNIRNYGIEADILNLYYNLNWYRIELDVIEKLRVGGLIQEENERTNPFFRTRGST